MTPPLKPCPVCGGPAEADGTAAAEIRGHCLQTSWVACTRCGHEVTLTGCTDCEKNLWAEVLAAWDEEASPEDLQAREDASPCPVMQEMHA